MGAAEFDAAAKAHLEDLSAGHRKAMQGMTEVRVENYIRGVIKASTGTIIGFYPVGPVTGQCVIKKVGEHELVVTPFTDEAKAIAARDIWGDYRPIIH